MFEVTIDPQDRSAVPDAIHVEENCLSILLIVLLSFRDIYSASIVYLWSLNVNIRECASTLYLRLTNPVT